ncbi:MAG TPA: hypothetical protein VGO04_28980 [Ensifer sp.]|jgi:hypothetical protein|uniref:hypothetical protein n=1 Tax=Ensifer sp. TaxID=1872086 RepID=UPI002E142C46|nr:hypothetical protein [Ensifer sp.]
MTTDPRITVNIDRLRVHGARAGDAAAFAEGLKAALRAQLAANPGELTRPGALSGQSADHVRVNPSHGRGQGPAALGRLTGNQIAGALTRAKGGG